ncbi:hypothetical protein M2347_001114 [Chryseobacterium sp. H1D6B]|uniref:hypothetical protein n=1 Tax=Chryseobacterium sp. H1D6B TaxID=2940588 RepID=UPI0015C6F464|nr:hypothetical protein [Chryseobacterium sp. H1D6B]MDH6251387.1 hypothetical protein [Chryseobacterium sp. H1D6B]
MIKTLLLFAVALFTLQSCNVNSEITYHKDAASSLAMNIDVREFMAEMKAMTPDSLNKKEFGDLDKLPTTWTSIYELEKKEGKLSTTNPDSIKVMKKIFMKSNKENNEYAGFSLKMDHFTKADYASLNSSSKDEKLPVDQNVFSDWDGKTLIIDTDNFNLKNLEKAMASKDADGNPEEESGKTEGMMTMFFKKVGTTLKFENKIKSITGKHDWFKQIDDHSVRIEYDVKAMYDKEAKLKNADKKIIIVTQ